MKVVKLILLLVTLIPGIIQSQIGTGPAPYCMPLYTSPPCNQPNPSNTPGNFVNDFINSYNTSGATFNINNNNSGCNAQNLNGTKNYRLWGCQYYMICSPGQVINSTFQSGIIYGQGCTVFVDWNNNGIYDIPTERMTSTPGVAPAGVTTPMPAWVVPNVPAGTYRMRVRCAYSTMGPTINPCTNYSYGECEEYFVYVNTTPGNMNVTLTSNSPVCVGGQVQINTSVTLGPGSGSCTANTYTYNWTGPMNYTSNVISPSFTATNVLQSGVYTLNISTPNGCGCGSTNTIQIWVNPNPSTSITNNGPVCKGSQLNFTNTISGSGTMIYNWTGPNGFTANTPQISFAQAQPTNTGVYNFTVVSQFTNGGQCQAQSTSSAVVVPVNQVSVVSSYTQCQGTNINLVATPGANTYSWTGPNLWTSSISNPTLNNIIPAQSGNYSVTAYYTSAQTTLVCSSSAVSNVSVVPMEQVVVSQPTNACQGINVILTASAQFSPTYNWSGPNGFNSVQQSLIFNNIQSSASGNYSVVAVWSIGQVSCQTSTTTSIFVQSPIYWKSNMSNKTLCKGDSFTLTPDVSGGTGNYAFTWSPAINNLTGSYQTGIANGTTYYNVSVYDIACPNYILNQSVLINVNSVSQPTLSLQNNKCEPLCQIFNSGVNNTSQLVVYTINKENFIGDSVNVCLSAGEYSVSTTILGKNGCKETFKYNDLIIVNKLPDAYFTWSPETLNTISENVAIFTHHNPKDVINWSWEINGDTTQVKSPSYTFEKQGLFPVTLVVTNKWDCKDTLTKIIKVENEFIFWLPNSFTPNGDGLNDVLRPKYFGIKNYSISIFDRWGSEIYSGNDQSKEWDGTFKGVICQDGVYVYQATIIDNRMIRHSKVGHVTLLK